MTTRKIPATMVTQHPDHASKPYWHAKPYISTQYEAEEAFLSFSELGATEYKWDWEGKLVDESVVERFFGEHFDFFSQKLLGEHVFLTYRLPNPRIETEFRLTRAFINMASAGSIAKHFGFNVPPLFEVILPMTETPEEMLALQEAFEQIHSLNHPLYKLDGFLTNLRVIPLFEKVSTIITSDKILEKYLSLYQKRFKKQPPYMRPYIARSDPALNSGLIATVLAVKIALSRYKKLSEKKSLPLYPVIGAGSLPFRGGLTPLGVEDFIREYKGIRTTTIQSAFRYDYPLNEVKKAIFYLEKKLSLVEAADISQAEEKELLLIIQEAENTYKRIVEKLAPQVNSVAGFIPKRRERFLHVGLFGYSRGEGVTLPRAISFTGALYSIGIPPEFIGTGQAIKFAKDKKMSALLKKYYINIKKDLIRAGRFLNKTNLKNLTNSSPAWKEVLESIDLLEKYLKAEFGPITPEEKRHSQLTKKILSGVNGKEDISQLITQAALLRKSLG